ncbi:unnamed protein product, partial [Pocillopora meandrina]
MKREGQELLERNGVENNNKQEAQPEVDNHEDVLENDYDREFWIKVRLKQSNGLSWSRAMDEVTVERLIQKYKDNGELDDEDPALLMLKQWPASKQYIDNPEKLPGLEQ